MSEKLFAWLSSVALLAGAAAVAAEEQQSATALQHDVLEEVVVHSQRREQRVLDVPIQVTAFDQDALERQRILTLEDLQNKVPSTYFGGTTNGTAMTVSIRGVGGSVTVFGEEPVAVFFDDQFLARGASATDLLDLQSIEVLRGPQGTLYGRNATAGAVLLRSNRPSLTTFSGQASVLLAQRDEQRIEAAAGGPLIDGVLGFRLAGLYSKVGGYYDNTLNTSAELGNTESSRVRASLAWAPTERTDILALVETGKNDGRGAQARYAIDSDNTVRIPQSRIDALESRRFALDSPHEYESEDTRALLSLTHAFGGFDLVVEAGYTHTDAAAQTDSDGTGSNLIYNWGRFTDESFTQDVRLVSTGEGPFRWIAGASLLQNQFDMPYFYIRNVPGGLNLGFFSKLDTRAAAAYLEGSYSWDNGLSLTLGGRATEERKKADVDQYFVVVASGFVIDPPEFHDEATWNNFSPRAVLEYRVNPGLNIYASYSRGFKGGGFNAFGAEPSYAPEKIIAYEVGAKARLLQGRLNLSAAAFSYDYEDLQIRLGVPQGGVAIGSARGAEVQGLELEFSAQPMTGLELSGSVSFLDTEYLSFLTPNLAGVLVDAAGGELSRAPDVQFSLAAAYEWSLTRALVARASASVSHMGDVTFTPTDQATRAWRGDAYTEVNLRASVASADRDWEIAAFVQNATDEFAVTSIVAAGNFPVASFNKPRTFGLELTRRF